MDGSGADALIATPWRLFLLPGAGSLPSHDFVDRPGDARMQIDACPGLPLCASATVETRALARHLATLQGGPIHVSGCAKGCARPRAAHRTLVGRDGRFDLVMDGCSWDEPARRGLSGADLMTGQEHI